MSVAASAARLALVLLPVAASAQQVRPWTPPFDAEVIDLPVAQNGVAYRLFVRKPISEPQGGEKPIVVYVLDALWDFPAVVAAHSNSEFLGHYPPIYYVGVGYQDENQRMRREEHRTRDYTPTAWAPADPSKHFLKPVDWEGSGGAAAFRSGAAARFWHKPRRQAILAINPAAPGSAHAPTSAIIER